MSGHWECVSRSQPARTWVHFGPDGKATRIETSCRDLDRALDEAAQYIGEPIDVGRWESIGERGHSVEVWAQGQETQS